MLQILLKGPSQVCRTGQQVTQSPVSECEMWQVVFVKRNSEESSKAQKVLVYE